MDKISTALLYKKWLFPVNAVIVNFVRRGGSTFCCCPLIATQRRWANLSTAGEARSSWPLTWAVGSATRCRKVLSLYSEFQITNFNCLRKNNSAQVGQNFKKHFPTTWRILQTPLLTNLDRSGGCVFFRINQFDKLEFAYLSFMQHPTMDNSNPTDAALIAMKLFVANAMPTKLTHTPMIPILIPFTLSHSFTNWNWLGCLFLRSVNQHEEKGNLTNSN